MAEVLRFRFLQRREKTDLPLRQRKCKAAQAAFEILAFSLNCRFLFLGLKKTTTNHIYLSFSFSVGVCGRHSVCVRAPGAWIPRWQILQKSIWRAVRLLTYRMSRAKRTVQKLNIALEHLNCSGIWLKCFLPPCSCCYKSSFSDTLSLS